MDIAPAASQVQLRCFPSADEEFAEHVYATAAGFAIQPPTCEALEAALRARYQRATVHVKTTLAGFGPEQAVWYVFRDSPITPVAMREQVGTSLTP